MKRVAARRVALLLLVGLLAGCGGGSKTTTATTTTTTPAGATSGPAAAMQALIAASPSLAGTVKVLFDSGDWAVVQSSRGNRAHAVVFRFDGSKWVPDQSGKVKVGILGPQPGATSPRARPDRDRDLVQAAVRRLGSLDRRQGAPREGRGDRHEGHDLRRPGEAALQPGTHVAVGYARNIANGTAVAWVFKTA